MMGNSSRQGGGRGRRGGRRQGWRNCVYACLVASGMVWLVVMWVVVQRPSAAVDGSIHAAPTSSRTPQLRQRRAAAKLRHGLARDEDETLHLDEARFFANLAKTHSRAVEASGEDMGVRWQPMMLWPQPLTARQTRGRGEEGGASASGASVILLPATPVLFADPDVSARLNASVALILRTFAFPLNGGTKLKRSTAPRAPRPSSAASCTAATGVPAVSSLLLRLVARVQFGSHAAAAHGGRGEVGQGDSPPTAPTWPSWRVREAYRLVVDRHVVLIEAQADEGLLNGVRSLAQLVVEGEDSTGGGSSSRAGAATRYYCPRVEGVPILVEDAPRFQHRGFLLDTAHHHLPVDTLERLLLFASFFKYNVFHWHATDHQSFGLRLDHEPSLAEQSHQVLGAPSSFYTPTDVARIKRFTRSLGMAIVPEIDVPGHVLAWEPAFPGIVNVRCGARAGVRKFPRCVANLDPTAEQTYEVLGRVLEGTRQLFAGSELLHLGGDEVDYRAWRASVGRDRKKERKADRGGGQERRPTVPPPLLGDGGRHDGESSAESGGEWAAPPLPPAVRPVDAAWRSTRVVLDTSQGRVVVEVHPRWSPRGAARFLAMVTARDARGRSFFRHMKFFRALPNFLVQFGIPADSGPSFHRFRQAILDDPFFDVAARGDSGRGRPGGPVLANMRGTIAFAGAGPNTRTTQIFVNLVDNGFIDRRDVWATPFGRVVEGMAAFDAIGRHRSRDVHQGRAMAEGNAYFDAEFPELEVLRDAWELGGWGAGEEGQLSKPRLKLLPREALDHVSVGTRARDVPHRLLELFEYRLRGLRERILPEATAGTPQFSAAAVVARAVAVSSGGARRLEGPAPLPSTFSKTVRWEEAFKPNLLRCCLSPLDTVLQFWKHPSTQKRGRTAYDAVRAGYEVIISSERYWYLDPQPKFVQPWTTRYLFDPLVVHAPASGGGASSSGHDEGAHEASAGGDLTIGKGLERRVRGGEVACWGRCMADEASLTKQALVPMVAVAERLWSAKQERDVAAARPRLEAALARLRLTSLFSNVPPLSDYEW